MELIEDTDFLMNSSMIDEINTYRSYPMTSRGISQDVVDHFIICESKYDHKGNKKEINFKLFNPEYKNKIRHIPIVENKLLIGIVSIGDVVKRLLEKFNLENQHLKSWLY